MVEPQSSCSVLEAGQLDERSYKAETVVLQGASVVGAFQEKATRDWSMQASRARRLAASSLISFEGTRLQ